VPDPVPRSPMSVGLEWASRIGTLGLFFSLPVLLGHYLDRKIGTSPVGLLIGMVLGFVVGMMQILRIARDESGPKQR
jgi:hypothetical protein